MLEKKIANGINAWDLAKEAIWARDINEAHREILSYCLHKSSLKEEELATVYKLVAELKPQRVVEIGLATGSSAVATVLAGATSIKRYSIVDPYQTTNFKNIGINNINSNCSKNIYIDLIQKPSYLALPQLLLNSDSFDYAFIDGSHRFDDTLLEIFFIDKMLVNGGVIVLDDRPWPMVGGVLNFVKENYVHYYIDCRHPRLTFLCKRHEDRRRWYDFRSFEIPKSASMEAKMLAYQLEQGTAF